MTKTDSKLIEEHDIDDKEDTIFEFDLVMEPQETFEAQKMRVRNHPRLRTTSYPVVSQANGNEGRLRKTSQVMERKWGMDEKEEDNGTTALEVVEEHFQMRRKQFQMDQENKRTQFLEQQLRETTEFEALLSELKLKHIRTLNAIVSRAKRNSAYLSDEGEDRTDGENSDDEEEENDDEEENENRNDRNIVNTVISDLECPGCKQAMKPPISIWRCEEGHLLCGHCRENQCNSTEDSHDDSNSDSHSIEVSHSIHDSDYGEVCQYSQSHDSGCSLESDSVRAFCPSCNAKTWTAGVVHRTGQIVARAVHIEKIAHTLFANQ